MSFKNLPKTAIFVTIIVLAAILRFWQLGTNPPGLYWDEAAFGYDAYSILSTGRDHHGRFMPLFFESFGDWKMPVYIYLLVPSIKIFGPSEFAVRFPAAFLGTLSVLIFYKIIERLTGNWQLSALSAFFLAISPWHIQFSRAGFESTTGLCFLLLGVYLFLMGREKRSFTIFTFGLLFFALSMYAYHAYRIFTPLVILVLLVIFQKNIKTFRKKLIVSFAFLIILLTPLVIFTSTPEGRARAISQTTFAKENYETERINFDQQSKKPLRFISKYWNMSLYFFYISLKNYAESFSPVFLFFKGDQIGRHSQVDMGQIYLFEGALLLLAPIAFKNLKKETKFLMLSILLFAPIPAVIVNPNPHAYRTLQMSVPLAFFSALGTYWLLSRQIYGVTSIFAVVVAYSFLSYLHLNFAHYPKKFAADWQDGYRQLVATVKNYQDTFDKVYVTNIYQEPYIYFLFYQRYDPQKFVNFNGTKNSFDKYVFITPDEDIYNKGRILYAAPHWQKVDGTWLAAVNDSNSKHIYSLWEVGGLN